MAENWSSLTIASIGALALLGIGVVSLFTSRVPPVEVDKAVGGPGQVGGTQISFGTPGEVYGSKEARGYESSNVGTVRYGAGNGPRPGWAGDPWPKSEPMTKIASGVMGLS